MLLRMLEEGMPVDIILFCDTGVEFDGMYHHIEKLEQYIGRTITRLKAPKSFEYYFYEYTPKRKNPKLNGYRGMSWAGPHTRWCTGMLKTRIINRYLQELQKEYTIIQYIGIAADEPRRVKEHRYPLVDWNMTEADCLAYCRERGFDWDGLYDIFSRVSCWCCPLQSLEGLRKLRRHFPELWGKLRYMDNHTWRKFTKRYTVEQLEIRFAFEDERQSQGLPIKGKAFFNALQERLQKHKSHERSAHEPENTETEIREGKTSRKKSGH